ncbi:Rho termination factor N-terminal domain-containing protein [Gracilimonas mengyeensis]|uniref:Rho termination factor, N-terminal domain n=1 Tax=Gracilimonas mengyeensis TaxID=1302730 RepID=A0A521ERY2_9BACT|nr:Rho termination factor N-terminal domain-containing protein [Gracilimonas mengyeensis]SMO86689.1 Rho termination factor, N-terminal domain [Gracilimonas mengyeensis]
MNYTKRELKDKNVKELRDIAKKLDHDAVTGYSDMKKSELVEAILKAQKSAAGDLDIKRLEGVIREVVRAELDRYLEDRLREFIPKFVKEKTPDKLFQPEGKNFPEKNVKEEREGKTKGEKEGKGEKEKAEKEGKAEKEKAEKEGKSEKEKAEKEGKSEKEKSEKEGKGEKEKSEHEGGFQPGNFFDPSDLNNKIGRVQASLSEQQVTLQRLEHFIKQSLRPDLNKGALRNEPDYDDNDDVDKVSEGR